MEGTELRRPANEDIEKTLGWAGAFLRLQGERVRRFSVPAQGRAGPPIAYRLLPPGSVSVLGGF
jgi:hypothetical protein